MKKLRAFSLVRTTKWCVILSGITSTKTMNSEETCFFTSEAEEVVRNTECCKHDDSERRKSFELFH